MSGLALERERDDEEKKLDQLRANLLKLINEERAAENVPPVVLDDLATRIATRHAEDMARHKYASHWDREGLKPYHRYSFGGGVHATQENISAADNTWSTKIDDLLQDTSYLHIRLYQEKPPNDGHRQTILAPQQTHVGLGIALDELRLRVVELFVAKHLDVNSVARKVKATDSFTFSARLTVPETYLRVIEVFYEPLPQEPDMQWLRQPRPYSLPKDSIVLRPKVPPPFLYTDRKPGVIEIAKDGTFKVPIRLFKKQAGIYTIVTWLERGTSRKAFPATEVCVRAE